MPDFKPVYSAELCDSNGWKKLSEREDLREYLTNAAMGYERLEALFVVMEMLKDHRYEYFEKSWASSSFDLVKQCYMILMNALSDYVDNLACLVLDVEKKMQYEEFEKHDGLQKSLNQLRDARSRIVTDRVKEEKDKYHKQYANCIKHGVSVVSHAEMFANTFDYVMGKNSDSIEECRSRNMKSKAALIEIFEELSQLRDSHNDSK